ncbi:MAG: sigma-70 family RNA polymerase sigma factor [Acidobacteriota bacterium]|jgi:RNA polymerase sigma-70 factor (ECF subfamily)|nr:sigma-70 family RNA polymerase sigma factor [Acidobacteriota bacterium]
MEMMARVKGGLAAQGGDGDAAAGFPPGARDAMPSTTESLELYERHHADVYRSAFRITGNASDAEDVLQTVFLRLLSQGGRPRLGDAQAEAAYIRRAAANAAIDVLRRRSTRAEVPIDTAKPHLVQKPETLLKERLRRALATLPPQDAELFLLRFVEGFSNEELSGLFGLEKNNVAVRLHRIRQTLQEEMDR